MCPADTVENTLRSFTIKAGLLSANDTLLFSSEWSVTNSANNKIVRIRTGAGLPMAVTLTTVVSEFRLQHLSMRNALNSQVGGSGTLSAGYGTSASAPHTQAIDFSADVAVTFTAQLANAGENITLKHAAVILIKNPIA